MTREEAKAILIAKPYYLGALQGRKDCKTAQQKIRQYATNIELSVAGAITWQPRKAPWWNILARGRA